MSNLPVPLNLLRNQSVDLPKKIRTLVYFFILLAISFFVVINIHEISHTITARILGDTHAHYRLVDVSYGKITAIGKNVYNLDLFNWWKIILISIAGVVGTQILVVIVLLLRLKVPPRSTHLGHFLNTLTIAGIFDLLFQEIQGLTAHIRTRTQLCPTGICGNDFADIFYVIYSKTSLNPFIIKILSVIVIIIYLKLIKSLYGFTKHKTPNANR